MTVNVALKQQMIERGLTQDELARRMNDALEEITGRPGEVSDRTVRNLLSGKTLRPIGRTCAALERVFGCPVKELGLSPPRSAVPPEDPVLRRTFITATTGTTAAPFVAASRQVGVSDVERLQVGLNRLTALDNHRGGHLALEKAALAGAQQALDLQQYCVSERVRQRLFTIAADYTSRAAWSCIDDRRPDQAQHYLDRSMIYAGMAQDSTAQFSAWNQIAMLARQYRRHTDAVAAGQAAQGLRIARRDPLFASLAHARIAIGQSNRNDKQAALRSLGHAQDALTKAAPAPRPGWIDFYGSAELFAITAIVQERLGMSAEAEASSHRALAIIPERFRRNRALSTVRLALAQLHQGDLDLACATVTDVFDIMQGVEIPGRIRTELSGFQRNVLDCAPKSAHVADLIHRLRPNGS
ncbi:helix-turn-helix transcriptional regulator [Streptomyces sp. NBC_01142]|uniref:helix-turn-helix transcriptional regulator n=1 Tax=Streptomyces sp. NBC_01142 TaxID=2975865 RepID=UPI0022541237|nr:helix-turn-helix transcriptional regulator [Streptomyces sp. NBC_01142]MCX4819465.1 helix-turn-helix transcriptional regulator [Streptomyces sp. NBC_01142]